MPKQREKDLEELLGKVLHEPTMTLVFELLDLRLERYKNCVIETGDELMRGRASECRELLKKLRPSKY